MENEEVKIKSGEEIRSSFYNGNNCVIEGLNVVGTPIVTQEGVTQITFRCADSSTYTYTYNQRDIEHMNDVYIFIVGDSGAQYATALNTEALNNPKQYATISVPSAYYADSTLESITQVLNKVADDYDFKYDTILSTGASAGAKRAAAMAMIAQNNIETTNCPIMAFWDAAGQGAAFDFNGNRIPGVVEYLREHPEDVDSFIENGGMMYQYCSVRYGGDGSKARSNFKEFAELGVPVVVVTNSKVLEHVDAQNMNYASGEVSNLFNGFINPILDGTTADNVYWIFKDGEWISYTSVEDVNKYIAECQGAVKDKKVKTDFESLETSMSSLESVLVSSDFSSGKTINVGFSSDTAVPLDENGIVTKLLSGMTNLISKLYGEIAAIREAGERIAYMEKTLVEEAMSLNLDIKGSVSPAVTIQEFQDILSIEELRAMYDKLYNDTVNDFMSISGDIPKETLDKIREYLNTEGIEYKNEMVDVEDATTVDKNVPIDSGKQEKDTVIVEEKEKERVSNGGTFLGDTVANIQATAGTPSQLSTPQIDEEERQKYINAAATASTAGLAALSGAEVNVGNKGESSLFNKAKEFGSNLFSRNKEDIEGGASSEIPENTTESIETIDATSRAAASISQPAGGTYVPEDRTANIELPTKEDIYNKDIEPTTTGKVQIKAEEEINESVENNKFNDDIIGKTAKTENVSTESELEEIDAITGAAPSVKAPTNDVPVTPSYPSGEYPGVSVTPASIDDVITPSEPEVPVEPTPVVPSEPEVPVEPTPVVPSEPEIPVEPTPVVPSEPEVPVEPTPVVPSEPEIPVEPTPVITEPTKPVDPIKPVRPVDPVKPVRPVSPIKPVNPIKPGGVESKPEEIVSPEVPVEVEPEPIITTPEVVEPIPSTVEYNGELVDETPNSGNGSAFGTIGTVAGVGLALGAAAYGVNQAVTKDKDDVHYVYENPEEDEEKESESLEEQYREYTTNEEGLNAFGGEN